MSDLALPPFGSTSAAGAMLIRQVRDPLLVGCMLAGLGTRRTLHFWASGKPMARSNEEHLQRVLAVVRRDRGSASKNRTLLLGPHEGAAEDGTVPLDLLATGDYESVVRMLGPGEARRAAPVAKLSAEARAARAPVPPAELVSALHDRIHPTSGRLLGAKAIVTSRRK
ncbi:MAG: hypothetical protein IPQ09_18675 [Myxococcales bacterium]|nr:hypothetical protein [Myxococcales bacterium]